MRITVLVFTVYAIFMIGAIFGKDVYKGEDYKLGAGTYNVVHVLGSAADPLFGRELIVTDLGDKDDHHFVTVTKECFNSYPKDALAEDGLSHADLLTVVSDDFCIWTTKQPPAPERP